MRRLLVVGTALAVLGSATAAFAASSLYTGSISFPSRKAGTTKRPAPTGFQLQLTSTQTSGRPPIQLDIKIRIYGLTVNGKNFPTCSLNKIAAAHNDNVCPKGSEVATGYIHSLLGSSTDFSKPGANCDPGLDVWNSGQGKLTYFFYTNAVHVCLGGALKTGATPPYPGTYQMQGKYFVSNVTVPRYIDYPVTGLVGSLQYEQLKFTTESKRVGRKTVYSMASVGCQKAKRPYSITTTTTDPTVGPQNTTQTISKSAGC